MAQGRDSYARMFARHGILGKLIRLGDPLDTEVEVKMLRRYAEEEPMAHEVSQQEVRFSLEWAQLNTTGFPMPVLKGDRILYGGEYFTIRLARPLETHGELIGYEVRCIGG